MKQVYELAPSDLEAHDIWYFPMDGSGGGDEMSVRPVSADTPLPRAYQMIVRATFRGSNGSTHPGYLYWSEDASVSVLKPLLWIGSLAVTFWNGIVEPAPAYVERVRAGLDATEWPIMFQSEPARRLRVIEGSLEGLYFFQDRRIACVRPFAN